MHRAEVHEHLLHCLRLEVGMQRVPYDVGDQARELDGERRQVAVGDAVLIPPGARHQIRADAEGLRFLCCCAPAYRHEDTFFD